MESCIFWSESTICIKFLLNCIICSFILQRSCLWRILKIISSVWNKNTSGTMQAHYEWMKKMIKMMQFNIGYTKEFKRGIGSLFDPCVNAMERQPYWPSHTEVSYCTFRFCSIIRRNLCTLSLLRDSLRDKLYACVI